MVGSESFKRVWTAATAASLAVGLSFGQTTERVSVATGGSEGNGGSSLYHSSVSADGRYVAFASDATNLVAGDTNGTMDVFVRDRQSGTTERVSVSTGGTQGNLNSGGASISADGRYVTFLSYASNLVAGDTNGAGDVFLRDLQMATTERVSLSTVGAQGNSDSFDSSISADGRYVVFTSVASNLVGGDSNGSFDIFLRDRQGLTTEFVSVATGGALGNASSGGPVISADGRLVAFYSSATNLVAGDSNGSTDVFVRDLQMASTERVSVDSVGSQANGNSGNRAIGISADGRYVGFNSTATNLVAGDTNAKADVFLRDRQAATTERVSVDSSEVEANNDSDDANAGISISADGRYVVFSSFADNLVASDTPGDWDVFLRNRQAGTTEAVSVTTSGVPGNADCRSGAMSPDGRFITFYGLANDLVPADTNSATDVFLRDNGAGDTDTESDGVGGAPANGNSSAPAVSSDGNFIAFQSDATNLVAGDTNGAKDVFVHDHAADTTVRASLGSGGAQANGASIDPAVSSDGRYVAFSSVATNLVAGDTNGVSDVFVRDTQSGTTVRVSVASSGTQAGGASFRPTISADGRYVAFDSVATNLVPGDTNAVADVFVRDLQTNTTTRASLDTGGTQGNGASLNPSFSADGRYVAFESLATNLVAGDTNAVSDIFLRDTVGSTTARMSVDSSGVQGNGGSFNGAMSGDGLWVGFDSDASNLVSGDSNTTRDVFGRNRAGNQTRRVSVDSGGTQGLGGGSSGSSVSFDGRYFAFQSDATNLVAGDTNVTADVFVHDRQFGQTRRVSVDSGGTQGLGGGSGGTSISADGRHVGFDSFASNLVDGDTNGAQDVFVRDQGTASAFLSFCFGDGTAGACPCANSGDPEHGCQNSSSTGGALLTATGVASISDDTVQLTSSLERPTALSVFLQGTAIVGPLNYGDGLRCTGGTLKRIYVKAAVNGVVVAPVGGDLSINARSTALGTPIPVGATRLYQVFYRDPPPGFCPSGTFNVSNGIAIAWGA